MFTMRKNVFEDQNLTFANLRKIIINLYFCLRYFELNTCNVFGFVMPMYTHAFVHEMKL